MLEMSIHSSVFELDSVPPSPSPSDAPINAFPYPNFPAESRIRVESESEAHVHGPSRWTSVKKVGQSLGGHAPYVTRLIGTKSSSASWFPLVFAESFFRSISSVLLASNPFSGLLIFVAMLIATPTSAVLASLALGSGIVTAHWVLRVPLDEIRAGGPTSSCYLMGTMIGELASAPNLLEAKPDVVPIAIVGGAFVMFCWGGLNGIISRTFNLPLLNSPFNLATILYVTSGIYKRYQSASRTEPTFSSVNLHSLEQIVATIIQSSNFSANSSLLSEAVEVAEDLSWTGLAGGVILAPSHLYGTNTILTGLMVYLALMLYSPILCFQSLMGATIGTVMGIGLRPGATYSHIYNGEWSYSPMLTAAALGGLFLIFNLQSWILSVAGAVLTVVFYAAMAKGKKPILGIPFMAITWLILPALYNNNNSPADSRVSVSQKLLRVTPSNVTTPEAHRDFLKEIRRPRLQHRIEKL